MEKAIYAIAAALVLAIIGTATAISQGRTANKAMEAIARQPEAAGDIRGALVISLALMETLAAEDARLEEEKQSARDQARNLLQQTEDQAAAEREEGLRQAKLRAKELQQEAREQMQSQNRQEDTLLTKAEPALAELLAERLLREEDEET